MIEIKGKSNIVVKVVYDSVSPSGIRLTTLELQYPRIIHSELMTHRMLSRNAASSRAIPFEKMLKQLDGKPVRFGAANKGMQDKGEDFDGVVYWEGDYPVSAKDFWDIVKDDAVDSANMLYQAGYHKQVYNRLLEPFQMIKTVVTATEWNNFFHLRLDGAADPTIYELAHCMKEAMDKSVPQELQPGEWHLPYVLFNREYPTNEAAYSFVDPYDKDLTLDQAVKVSAARCAAVSFRNEDYGLEKCLEVYDRLVGDERVHASALEHQATPMKAPTSVVAYQQYVDSSLGDASYNGDKESWWEVGVTHADRSGDLWSGNLRNWIQHRQLIPNHVKKG